jgi:hypothetical protein
MPLTTETAEALRRYRHAANCLAAAQLYQRATACWRSRWARARQGAGAWPLRNFRIVWPNELTCNKLDAVLEATARAWQWPTAPHDTGLAPDGRVMKELSEHTCQAWLQGATC